MFFSGTHKDFPGRIPWEIKVIVIFQLTETEIENNIGLDG